MIASHDRAVLHADGTSERMGARPLAPPGDWSLAAAWEALEVLVVRYLKLKYKRSVLGFLWSLLTPLALMGIYLFVFGRVFDAPQRDFGLFLLAGLVPWQFFNVAVLGGTFCLVGERELLRRLNFPPVLVPFSAVLAHLLHLFIALACLVVVVALAGRAEWSNLGWLVLAVTLQTALCLGLALALSIWNVRLRDVGYLMPPFLVVLFFATPVVYELSQVPDAYRALTLSNPLSMIMEAYRAALLGGPEPAAGHMLLSAGETALVAGLGYAIFTRSSRGLPKEL